MFNVNIIIIIFCISSSLQARIPLILAGLFKKTHDSTQFSSNFKQALFKKNYFDTKKTTFNSYGGFSHKSTTFLLEKLPKIKGRRQFRPECIKWIGGKWVDTCSSEYFKEFFVGLAAGTAASSYDYWKNQDTSKQQNYKSAQCARLHNLCEGSIAAARTSAQQKLTGSGDQFSFALINAVNDKVYTWSEVKELRDKGVTAPILTVNAKGEPVYDQKEGTSQSKTVEEYREDKKPRHDKNQQSSKNQVAVAGGDPKDPRDPYNKNNNSQKNDTPIGQHGKYQDAGYHHPNCKQGHKSPAPKNGQLALNNSYLGKGGKGDRRVALEDGKFVILSQTTKNEFHGHVVESWNKVPNELQKALVDAGLVTSKGKIITCQK